MRASLVSSPKYPYFLGVPTLKVDIVDPYEMKVYHPPHFEVACSEFVGATSRFGHILTSFADSYRVRFST